MRTFAGVYSRGGGQIPRGDVCSILVATRRASSLVSLSLRVLSAPLLGAKAPRAPFAAVLRSGWPFPFSDALRLRPAAALSVQFHPPTRRALSAPPPHVLPLVVLHYARRQRRAYLCVKPLAQSPPRVSVSVSARRPPSSESAPLPKTDHEFSHAQGR